MPTQRPTRIDPRIAELERDLARERRERERDEASLGEMMARIAGAEREKNKALSREAKAVADAAERLLEATAEMAMAERAKHGSEERLRASEDRAHELGVQLASQREEFERALANANTRLRDVEDARDTEVARAAQDGEAARERDRLAFEIAELRETTARTQRELAERLARSERQAIELAGELGTLAEERNIELRRREDAMRAKEAIEEEIRSLDAALSLEVELREGLEAHSALLERELLRLRMALLEAERDANARVGAAVSAAQQLATLSAREAEVAQLRQDTFEQVRAVLATAPMRVTPPAPIPKRPARDAEQVIDVDDDRARE